LCSNATAAGLINFDYCSTFSSPYSCELSAKEEAKAYLSKTVEDETVQVALRSRCYENLGWEEDHYRYIISFSFTLKVAQVTVNFYFTNAKPTIDTDSNGGTFCVHHYVEHLGALPNFGRRNLCFSFGRLIRFSCQRCSCQDDR